MSNRHVLFILCDLAFIAIGVAVGLLLAGGSADLGRHPQVTVGKSCQSPDVEWEVIYEG